MIRINRALISVSDKKGIVDFASGLSALGVEIISTGGTGLLLKEKGLEVKPVSDLTGFPEILDGRVKTLTPQVHGAILARRDKEEHLRQIKEHGIAPIDMVVVNLYPFEATINKPGVTFEEAIENIDIGGPAMLRSAAKNFAGVAVVTDPADYGSILDSLRNNECSIDEATSFKLAKKVFRHTSQYDSIISAYLEKNSQESKVEEKPGEQDFIPEFIHLILHRRQELRYGENPHQKAGIYEAPGWIPPGLVQAEKIQGKALSFNNLIDLDSAWAVVSDFEETAVSIIKHTNPCGAAIGKSVEEAYNKALAADPVSAFGGIVGCNRMVSPEMAEAMSDIFLEAVIAADYHPDALSILGKKKNLRLIRFSPGNAAAFDKLPDMRTISGGLLLQEKDKADRFSIRDLEIVTSKKPTEKDYQAMAFAWKIIRHIKSNAIVFTSHDRMLSMGAGQTSRVQSVQLAMETTRLPLHGSALASDAFFPFRDGLDMAAKAGATAIIQPGGSIRDKEVISAAEEHGLVMVFTGRRHFRH